MAKVPFSHACTSRIIQVHFILNTKAISTIYPIDFICHAKIKKKKTGEQKDLGFPLDWA